VEGISNCKFKIAGGEKAGDGRQQIVERKAESGKLAGEGAFVLSFGKDELRSVTC
jgi:hypothetical protein